MKEACEKRGTNILEIQEISNAFDSNNHSVGVQPHFHGRSSKERKEE